MPRSRSRLALAYRTMRLHRASPLRAQAGRVPGSARLHADRTAAVAVGAHLALARRGTIVPMPCGIGPSIAKGCAGGA